jgi:hypothetical protein
MVRFGFRPMVGIGSDCSRASLPNRWFTTPQNCRSAISDGKNYQRVTQHLAPCDNEIRLGSVLQEELPTKFDSHSAAACCKNYRISAACCKNYQRVARTACRKKSAGCSAQPRCSVLHFLAVGAINARHRATLLGRGCNAMQHATCNALCCFVMLGCVCTTIKINQCTNSLFFAWFLPRTNHHDHWRYSCCC